MRIVFVLILFCITEVAASSPEKIEIGIDEQLGKIVPKELVFSDENGNSVELGELINSPVVFAFVYYNCPGICHPLMAEISDVVNNSELVPGKDYRIITLSIDEFETPQIASEKKNTFTALIDKNFPDSSWLFLTGDSLNIKQLADACGFYFKREGKDFVHTGALIFLSPEGKISRYLFPAYSKSKGYGILPFDFKMAVIEASEGKTTPTIAKVLQFCFSYNPEGQTYVLNLTRIFGAGILILVGAFLIFVVIKPKKRKS
ncbi:MAG: SCO family protein [Ignavibacteriales bacterium]|nr:MAG: SCO family protein [Ignavibacteriales bacterium]